MTPHQVRALRHYCRFAFETAHPRFGWVAAGHAATVILTVNSGYE
jgi:hypothetical protein